MSSYFPNHLNTGPEPLVGKGSGTKTALYSCRAFCLTLVMGLSRDWWFMQQLQCRPGAEMWESPVLKGKRVLGKVCASLITCILLCQTGSEICSAVSLCDMNCQLVTGEFAVEFFLVDPQIQFAGKG